MTTVGQLMKKKFREEYVRRKEEEELAASQAILDKRNARRGQFMLSMMPSHTDAPYGY